MNVNKLITKSVISDYTPSQVNDYYTLLEQLEFIKQLLQKYPSTQFFYTTQSYSSSATIMAQSRITLSGRTIAVGDFIFSTITNTNNQLGLWQVTGFSGTSVNVYFIGNLAEQGEQGENALVYTGTGVIYNAMPTVGETKVIASIYLSRVPKVNDVLVYWGRYDNEPFVLYTVCTNVLDDNRGEFNIKLVVKQTVTAEDIYNLLEGSDTIVADLNEDGTAVELHLDNEVLNDITNSLKKPLAVTEPSVVGVYSHNGVINQGIWEVDTNDFNNPAARNAIELANHLYKWLIEMHVVYNDETFFLYSEVFAPVEPQEETAVEDIEMYVFTDDIIFYNSITEGFCILHADKSAFSNLDSFECEALFASTGNTVVLNTSFPKVTHLSIPIVTKII